MELRDSGLTDEQILQEVKKRSSFEGPMRRNLIAMLDDLGLASHLGLKSTEELFGKANHLVHTASILPHAVFFSGKNYNGSSPDMVKTDILWNHMANYFAKDHAALKGPLIIPLGVYVSKAMEEMGKRDLLDIRHLLKGFPHTSGANGHRHRQFAENRDRMAEEIARYFS